MQTFMPYGTQFKRNARCLDYRRLGKQRVECLQIINCLEGRRQSWQNHPAVLMWTGHIDALKAYGNEMIKEWIRRGYNNTMRLWEHEEIINPPWASLPSFCSSHKSNLLRKDPAYYSKFNWSVSSEIPYFWPTVDWNTKKGKEWNARFQ